MSASATRSSAGWFARSAEWAGVRLIEVIAAPGYTDTVVGIAQQQGAVDYWTTPEPAAGDTARQVTRILVVPGKSQGVVDALQSALGGAEDARVVIQAVEATLPRVEAPPAESDQAGQGKAAPETTREELYDELEKGAVLDRNYLLLVVLSTLVAAIGLIEDNIAVIIGAMVIAPLLGPNLALAFGTALGETRLMGAALRTTLAALAVSVVLAFAIGWLWPVDMRSYELASRTDVGLAGVALALASGAAAALSIVSGISTALVGVMVAVALLPPAATLGLMLGEGALDAAAGAGMLLAVNVVCVNLAAKLVFLYRGISPRCPLDRERARRSLAYYIVFWVVSLLVLVAAIVVRHPEFARGLTS